MEPAINWIKGLSKSFNTLSVPAVHSTTDDARRDDPIEILKRLQREAFSDLMKLRERQDKIERVLSLYQSTNNSTFQDARTRVKGVIDVVGAWLFADASDEQSVDMLSRAGIRTGIDSRFMFETTVRQKDILTAELVASNKSTDGRNHPWSSLALAKVTYLASINDWLSISTIPMGAQCRDFRAHALGDISWFEPPTFSEYHSCAAAVNIATTKLTAAVAGLAPSSHQHSNHSLSCLATFGQCSFQPFEGTKINFSGLWQVPRSPFRRMKIGPLAIPIFGPRQRDSDAFTGRSTHARPDQAVGGSITLMIDSELDDSTKVGGWVQKDHLDYTQWSLFLTDLPDDELGWGLRVGGSTKGSKSQVHFEGFLNFNFGKRFNLQPGLVYALNGSSQKPVITLRTNWTL